MPHLATCIFFLFNYWMNQDWVQVSILAWLYTISIYNCMRFEPTTFKSRVKFVNHWTGLLPCEHLCVVFFCVCWMCAYLIKCICVCERDRERMCVTKNEYSLKKLNCFFKVVFFRNIEICELQFPNVKILNQQSGISKSEQCYNNMWVGGYRQRRGEDKLIETSN